MRTDRAAVLGACFLAASAIWASACASSETDPEDGSDAEAASSSSSSSGSSSTAPPERPAFDASFAADDAGTGGGTNGDAGGGGVQACLDADDPGGSENLAKQLPSTDDCDNNLKNVNGVMNGGVDIDFYKVSGTDKAFCALDTEFSSKSADIEMCVYARCKNNTANAVTGCVGGTLSTSSTGWKGCCATMPGNATPKWDCSGFTDNDSADFVIRVRETPGKDECLAYTFSYRF